MEREVEKHFSRHELRRVPFGEVGAISYPTRARDGYAEDLLAVLDVDAIRERGFRIVVDYGYSSASHVLPFLLGRLVGRGDHGAPVRVRRGRRLRAASSTRSRRRAASSARSARSSASSSTAPRERLYLVDEQAEEVSPEQVLLLFLRLLGSNGRHGKLVAADDGHGPGRAASSSNGLEVVRTPASLAGADEGGGRRERRLRGRGRRRVRLPGLPPGLRRGRLALQAARAARAAGPAAVGARRRAAGLDARPPRRPVLVGAEGHGDARPQRALRERERRPARRPQGLRRARLGAGAARPRRARDPHLRRGVDPRASRTSSRRSSAGSSPRCSRGRRFTRRREPDRLAFSS